MNIEVKIACPELAQALNNLAAAIAGRTGETLPVTPKDEAATPKPTRARAAAKTETTEPSTPPTSEQTEEPDTSATASEKETSGSAETDQAEGGVDYADIKKAVVALSLKHGREKTVAVLGEFGVPEGQKADTVDEARWPELLARLTEEAGK